MVNSSFNDEQCVLVCFDLFEGGSETTSTTLSWSVLYIALHPEIQQKCQIEIDEEIGSRPPTSHLPILPGNWKILGNSTSNQALLQLS